jgi:hypothetical protein
VNLQYTLYACVEILPCSPLVQLIYVNKKEELFMFLEVPGFDYYLFICFLVHNVTSVSSVFSFSLTLLIKFTEILLFIYIWKYDNEAPLYN